MNTRDQEKNERENRANCDDGIRRVYDNANMLRERRVNDRRQDRREDGRVRKSRDDAYRPKKKPNG